MKASMLVRILTFGALLTALLATAEAKPPAEASTTKKVSANIKGTFGPLTPGNCPTGYANQCASGTCFIATPVGTPTISGTFGTGTITGLCVTLDAGDPVNTDGSHTCVPIFGDMVVVVTKSGTNTAVNFTGAYCHHQPTSSLDAIEAGFGIDGADSTDTAETGWGTLTGTVNKNTGATLLKAKGNFTP